MAGLSGVSAVAGLSGVSAVAGLSGVSAVAVAGLSGVSAVAGLSGVSAVVGLSGVSAVAVAGLSGVWAVAGLSGMSAVAGLSGVSAGAGNTVTATVDTVTSQAETVSWRPPTGAAPRELSEPLYKQPSRVRVAGSSRRSVARTVIQRTGHNWPRSCPSLGRPQFRYARDSGRRRAAAAA